MQLERGLLLSFAVFLSHTQAQKHTHAHTQRFSEFQAPVIMLKERRGKPHRPAQCGRQRRCHAWRLRTAQRLHSVEMRRVSQAHFVLSGEAVGQVVAFCQQVKTHCKVPPFPTPPAVAPNFRVCSLCWAVGPVGRGDAASTVCADACSLFCGA